MDFINKTDFRKQIAEDIKDYQNNFPNIPNIKKDEWAFNFWILDKLYSEDEDLIEEKIIDYNDKGIDCYVWHEEFKNLYLIQNKYYDDNSSVTVDYYFNDFLTRSIGSLEKNTYNHSPELQKIFNKYKDDEDFQVYLYLYVTNNCKVNDLDEKIKEYNRNHKNYETKIFYLNDINDLYFNEPKIDKKELIATIATINKETILNIDTEHYGMGAALDARYVLTPVNVLYDLYQNAKKQSYPIFDDNIRDFLGSKGNINKNIKNTLLNEQDRNKFFYYNNGITVICEDIQTVETGATAVDSNCNAYFNVKNPQIVNGCQTVSTINEVLDQFPDSTRPNEFKNTYVMVKFLKINDKNKDLYKEIVRFNNSQNSIDEKTFTANKNEFIRIQTEFERRGFLLLIKQSDKYKYSENYKTTTNLISKNSDLIEKYGLEYSNVKDFMIPLEKFLQVLLAFSSGAQQAIQKKSQLLVAGSLQYNAVINLIKSPSFTIKQMLDLYLMYSLCEKTKKKSQDNRTPIPLYVIDCINRFECQGDYSKLDFVLREEEIQKLIKDYQLAISLYTNKKIKEGIEYNTMIKSEIDYDELKNNVEIVRNLPIN